MASERSREHYSDGRQWSVISQAWILDSSWNDREEIASLREQLAEAERQRDAHADLACEWRRELGALRQQLEQSQQLVTDGQEAIGHWQGEYEQLRQRVDELEQALRLHLAVAADDPILITPIEVQVVKALARIQELEAR